MNFWPFAYFFTITGSWSFKDRLSSCRDVSERLNFDTSHPGKKPSEWASRRCGFPGQHLDESASKFAHWSHEKFRIFSDGSTHQSSILVADLERGNVQSRQSMHVSIGQKSSISAERLSPITGRMTGVFPSFLPTRFYEKPDYWWVSVRDFYQARL